MQINWKCKPWEMSRLLKMIINKFYFIKYKIIYDIFLFKYDLILLFNYLIK